MMILKQTRGVLSSGGFDRLAARYISAVEAAGASVTQTQKTAINAFFKKGRSEGWLSSMKRVFLPIWGAALPSAIDMCSGTSGTFIGTPTYGTSTVSFASSAYFNTGTSFSEQGLSASSGYIFTLVTAWTGVGNYLGGSGSASNQTAFGRIDSSNLRFRYSGNTEGSGQLTATGNDGTLGIISASRQGGFRKIYRRSNTNRSQVATLTSGDLGAPQPSNVFFGGYNNTNLTGVTQSVTTSATLGSFGFALGLTDAQDSAFTLAIKTLWETCTGATLP